VRVVSVELGKAQGCSAVAAATRVAVVLAAPKSLLKGLNSMQLDRLLGLGSLRLTRFDPNTHAPPKDPYLVLPAPQFRPLVNTLSPTTTPPSTKLSILTPYSPQPYYRASGASLVSEGVGSTTSLVSNPHRRFAHLYHIQTTFLYLYGQLLILHHDDHRQWHNRCRDKRTAQLVAIQASSSSPLHWRQPLGRSCSRRR
jgi:hypothetical protein